MGNYITTVAVNIAVFSLLALSLNIIIGYAGQSMMGHAAFFGIGAYTAAILTNKGISFWLALLASLIVSGALGAILGIISLRLRDDFLAITTIGINFVMVALFQNMKFFWWIPGNGSKTTHHVWEEGNSHAFSNNASNSYFWYVCSSVK